MPSTSLVLHAAAILDGTGSPALPDAALWIRDGRIAHVGPAAELPAAAADDPAEHLPGATVLPGLVDAHVHLVASAGPNLAAEVTGSPAERALTAAVNAHRHLQAGTTLVRDLGAPADEAIAVGRAVEQGRLPGPRVVAAGPAITMTGGHIPYLGRVADGVDGVRAAVRANAALGAGCIKVVATGGVLTPGLDPRRPAYLPEELTALVDEAHRLGLHVAAHAIGEGGVAAALRAGADSIEHGMFLDETTIRLFVETGARLVPTFSPVHGILDGQAPAWTKQRARPARSAQQQSFRAALDAGVRVVAGTDAGTPDNHHGTVAGEIAHMIDAGMTPSAAIRAATSEAAELLGLPDRGVLRPGAAADVLAVAGDPLRDPAALTRPVLVLQDGRRIR